MKTDNPYIAPDGTVYDELLVSLALHQTPTPDGVDTSLALSLQPCRLLPNGTVDVPDEDIVIQGEEGPITHRVKAGGRAVSMGSAKRNKDQAIKTATDALLRAVERLVEARTL